MSTKLILIPINKEKQHILSKQDCNIESLIKFVKPLENKCLLKTNFEEQIF